jgi:hypothetical protein
MTMTRNFRKTLARNLAGITLVVLGTAFNVAIAADTNAGIGTQASVFTDASASVNPGAASAGVGAQGDTSASADATVRGEEVGADSDQPDGAAESDGPSADVTGELVGNAQTSADELLRQAEGSVSATFDAGKEVGDELQQSVESSVSGDVTAEVSAAVADEVRSDIQEDVVTDVTRSLPLPGSD